MYKHSCANCRLVSLERDTDSGVHYHVCLNHAAPEHGLLVAPSDSCNWWREADLKQPKHLKIMRRIEWQLELWLREPST